MKGGMKNEIVKRRNFVAAIADYNLNFIINYFDAAKTSVCFLRYGRLDKKKQNQENGKNGRSSKSHNMENKNTGYKIKENYRIIFPLLIAYYNQSFVKFVINLQFIRN